MADQKRFVAKNGLDNNNQTITSVADPVNPQDASNKAFSSNASNLSSGTLPAARLPALTGDVTTSAGSNSTVLVNSGVTAGTYKSVTVDAKGRVTGGTNPTTLSGYGITDAAPLASPALTGTPTAPTATAGTNSTQLATTAFVATALATETAVREAADMAMQATIDALSVADIDGGEF